MSFRGFLAIAVVVTALIVSSFARAQIVVLETDLGKIEIALFSDKAPLSTKNFLDYVDSHFYDGTIFHRVIPNFVVQGGGLRYDFSEKETKEPVVNESANGLKNLSGTVAMARFSDPDSATAQFYVNMRNNPHLDPAENKPGYTVFGEVISGMEVLYNITQEPQGMYRKFPNAPNNPIRILKAYRKK